MEDVSYRGPTREIPDAEVMLGELERISKPTQFAKGRLAALRMSKLDRPARLRVDALVRRWAGS
jgi:hypothetical protein